MKKLTIYWKETKGNKPRNNKFQKLLKKTSRLPIKSQMSNNPTDHFLEHLIYQFLIKHFISASQSINQASTQPISKAIKEVPCKALRIMVLQVIFTSPIAIHLAMTRVQITVKLD